MQLACSNDECVLRHPHRVSSKPQSVVRQTHLSREDFTAWLEGELANGATRAALGARLGVTHEAVRLYLKGMTPSPTVLILAALLAGRGGAWPPVE